MQTREEIQGTIPSLFGTDAEVKREEILHYFLRTFELFEKVFEPFVSDDVFYLQPDPQRHPLIFYFGHTAAFFINKLMVSKVIDTRIDPHLESMFAIGVDEMSWDDMQQEHYRWPTVSQAKAYREAVKTKIVHLIQTQPLTLPITWDDPFWWVILMGIEHENIHIETSSVLHRQLSLVDVSTSDFWKINTDRSDIVPANTLVTFAKTTVTLGKSHKDDYYGWDNEYGHYEKTVDAFKTSQFLVSNGEFLAFVQAKGYETRDFWSDEAWEWLQHDKRNYPKFWIKQDNGDFHYRTLFEEIALPLNWPVEVNYHEAKAFCSYKQGLDHHFYTLLTQEQWEVLAHDAKLTQLDQGNIRLQSASACAVDSYKMGKVYDVCGNVWQWTESFMDGFDGFKPHPVYDDFSTPTYDGKHNILKGGSFISLGNATLASSRYAFRRHFMQHAGFRYVQTNKEVMMEKMNNYETDTQVSQYCDFHYGVEHFGVENFAKNLATLSANTLDQSKRTKALDLGCAVGRASFELAHYFDEVTGVDFSARFIQVGTHLKEGGKISYKRQIEGDISEIKTVSLDELGYVDVAKKVDFLQGDACNLKPIITGYDLVMAVNLIDRLYEPELFLKDIVHRINSGGVLVISSPYTWLEEFTAKEHWLGGFVKEGKDYFTLDALDDILSEHFDRLQEPVDIPFVIRETKRKYQHTLAEVSFWKKR